MPKRSCAPVPNHPMDRPEDFTELLKRLRKSTWVWAVAEARGRCFIQISDIFYTLVTLAQ